MTTIEYLHHEYMEKKKEKADNLFKNMFAGMKEKID